jgi:hypothetical protein
MNHRALLLALAAAALAPATAPAAEPRLPLRVLYVGDDPGRTADYAAFLGKHFAEARTARRTGFDPATARSADVVLLDWSQSETPVDKAASPFGPPEGWSKPTVLLGSAGLLLAGQWQLIGGAG